MKFFRSKSGQKSKQSTYQPVFEEIHEPLQAYQSHLKQAFQDRAVACFEALLKESAVDVMTNGQTVAKIRKLEQEIARLNGNFLKWSALRACCIIASIIGFGCLIYYFLNGFAEAAELTPITGQGALIGGLVGAVAVFLIKIWINPKIAHFREIIGECQERLQALTDSAWEQMDPLNRLFQWDTVAKIVMETCPILTLDKYFSQLRMDELSQHFQWTSYSSPETSILFCQSGAINGNPFVLAKSMTQEWGTAIYQGTKQISWKERETYTDSKGHIRSRMVTRHQTLVATVTKPKPEYVNNSFLVYGNEAAPDLSFSREPSSLSSLQSGWFAKWRKKVAIKGLFQKARSLKSDFMVMANEEFDATFGALNRNNEQQFRLLFTPLAQQEMLKLLKDHGIGYGDDFTFNKNQMINTITPEHLQNFDISASPDIFKGYDCEAMRATFINYSCEYFKILYFTLAPLLCIPLYQSHRSTLDIYRDVYGDASFWEQESLVNSMDDSSFAHPASITTNILKTETAATTNSGKILHVTASGFRGEDRIDFVSCYGGDGKSHKVPVKWIEYLPVQKQSAVLIKETDGMNQNEFASLSDQPQWQALLDDLSIQSDSVFFRRSIASYILNNQ